MNQLLALSNEFLNGRIPKHTYIERFHDEVSSIFALLKYLRNTSSDIKNITIGAGGIVLCCNRYNTKLKISPEDAHSAAMTILSFGEYEKDFSKWIVELSKNARTFFDIGANTGWYSLVVGKTYKNIDIYAFEPIHSTYAALQENIRLNRLSNVHSFNFGFGETTGEEIFYFEKRISPRASMANLGENPEADKIICKVSRLDDFLSKTHARIDVIKCDVEGAELMVIKGGIDSIRKHKPVIFCELLRKWSKKFHYHPNDVIDLLMGVGYFCYVHQGSSHLRRFEHVEDSTEETNYIFLNEHSHHLLISKYCQEKNC